MKRVTAMALIALVSWVASVEASERSMEKLPQDVWGVATAPITSIAKETRRFDPVSGLWFGLVEGSIKSFERTAGLLLQNNQEPSGHPAPSEKPLLRYSF